MLKEIIQAVLLVGLVVYLLPVAVMLGLWALIYGIVLIPIIGIGYLTYRFIKEKGYFGDTVIPTTAKPVKAGTPRKPRMIKWQGKEIPLGVFVFSMILTVIMVPIVLFVMMFYIPPFWNVLILAFIAGKGIGVAVKGAH